MGFTISKKSEKNVLELIKLLTNKFNSEDAIKSNKLDNLSKELENEYYFRSTFDRFNCIFKSNPSNDLYLGGRIHSFNKKTLKDVLINRYKEMMYADNISIIINDKLNNSMIKELNKYFGNLPSYNQKPTIKNGTKLNANLIYSNNDSLYLSFSLPYTISSYISSFYFNIYISKTLDNNNLVYDLSTDGYNFIYTVYNFYSYEQMYYFLEQINNRNYFTNLSKYNINSYYSYFMSNNNFFNRTYEIALPLFRNDMDMLYNFYSGNINIYPYIKTTIPYFYSLHDLYIVGDNNIFLMNKQDINGISYNKFMLELDFTIKNNSIKPKCTNNKNYLNYFYLKNKDSIFQKIFNISAKESITEKDNIMIKYTYNIKNYLVHQMLRLFMNIKNKEFINSITVEMNNNTDLSNFIYLLIEEYDILSVRKLLKKNELLFIMNLITNYILYNNTFHPSEVIQFLENTNNNIKILPYEFNLNTSKKTNLENLIKYIKLESKGYDLKIDFKNITEKQTIIQTEYDFFIFITDTKLDYTNILWTMKEMGLLYTMIFNNLNKYTIVRAPSIDPMGCVKYLNAQSGKGLKYSLISLKSNITKINI
jgi:hypothetical protein